MEYKIEYDTIVAIAEEEVSREGMQAYSEDGASLYDGIRMISRDEDKKKRIMSEVLALVQEQCNRFIRHAELIDEEEIEEPLSLYIELELSPRRAAGKKYSLATLFRSMTVNFFLNRYFVSKNLSELAAKYDAAALADVQTTTKLLYTKLPPSFTSIAHE